MIFLLITDKKGRVLYVGNLYLGSEVDINIFKKELTDWQKIINYEINRVRIKVEHAIDSVKRYYILRHEN